MIKAIRPSTPILIIGGSCVAALLIGLALSSFWTNWRWQQEPLHSTLEALGGLAAIAMAMVLFHSTAENARRKFYPVAGGFLGMGLLEVFHAMSIPGNGFVLLRSIASLFGGIGFGLVWLSAASEKPGSNPWWMPWVIAGGALTCGLWVMGHPEQVPVMIRHGEFTPTAIAPKSLACMFFLLAAGRFFLDHHRSAKPDDLLFACLALLFGLAELMFTYSTIWDGAWWFWHLLRLTAYLLVLGYVGRGYLTTVSDLQHALDQTKQAEETIRRSERQLREVLEERERLAQDLHDGAIQSIFTLGLSLERCQRLIPKDPNQAISKVGDVIADLKLVIRDLRNYISGNEDELEKTLSMEEAIASLVRSINHSSPFLFRMHVDPIATKQLTAAEADDLMYIMKEAMSNSVRHAQATSGSISLQMHKGTFHLEIKDNGLGFDTSNVQDPGNGLGNMAARARRLGARFEVLSIKGKGTCIIIEIHKKGNNVTASG